MNSKESQQLKDLLLDPWQRINTLYRIVDKDGRKLVFKPNFVQSKLYKDMWYSNIILKARQLGISTFLCILFLDRCLFNPDLSAGIIAHTVEDAQHLFKRVKIAYDNLPEPLKKAIPADNDTAQMLKFKNGSSIRIGTSLRSSTFQYLHISEFGKICAKYPDKAEEIITGSLNTVAPGQYTFIESTAEGRDGYFFNMCKLAQEKQQKRVKLSKLDYKFHFYPWYEDPSYRIGNSFPFTDDMSAYFAHLKSIGISLDEEQKNWYIGKQEVQQDNMRREYPSTPEEAWEVSHEGLYYSKQMTEVRSSKRICKVPYDDMLGVYTAWDLGYNDSTAIWFFQIHKREIRLIDYCEGSDSMQHWIGVVKKKDYAYESHLVPHDIKVHEYSTGEERIEIARNLGIILTPVPKTAIMSGIDRVRNILNRCWFDEDRCTQGIKCLDGYKKEWNEQDACWRSKPLHNWASHGADAMRTLACGLDLIEVSEKQQVNHNPIHYQQRRFSNF